MFNAWSVINIKIGKHLQTAADHRGQRWKSAPNKYNDGNPAADNGRNCALEISGQWQKRFSDFKIFRNRPPSSTIVRRNKFRKEIGGNCQSPLLSARAHQQIYRWSRAQLDYGRLLKAENDIQIEGRAIFGGFMRIQSCPPQTMDLEDGAVNDVEKG